MMRSSKNPGTMQTLGIVPAWVLAGVGAGALLLAWLAASSLPDDVSVASRYALAPTCPTDAPSVDCKADLAGETLRRIDRRTNTASGGGITTAVLHVDVPEAPEGTRLFHGAVVVQISPADADRLDLRGRGDDITVTLFDGEARTITGPNGESATSGDAPVTRVAAVFAMAVAFGVVALFCGGYVVSRVRLHGWGTTSGTGLEVPLPGWLPPLSVGLLVGAGLGAALGWLAGTFITVAWLLPVMLGGAVIGTLVGAVVWRRTRACPIIPG